MLTTPAGKTPSPSYTHTHSQNPINLTVRASFREPPPRKRLTASFLYDLVGAAQELLPEFNKNKSNVGSFGAICSIDEERNQKHIVQRQKWRLTALAEPTGHQLVRFDQWRRYTKHCRP